jgi:hypothetical protein
MDIDRPTGAFAYPRSRLLHVHFLPLTLDIECPTWVVEPLCL